MASQLPAQAVSKPPSKHGNVLPLWGNEKTMNLNPMILTNVLSSPYFKVQLYELKTYHEVVDEIYFKVTAMLSRMLS
uniref:Pre-mRNA-splicing factor 38B n=1 Tax=Gouania willdenowi TaxID=441366 RepID=A0A8C5HCD0_GOUWI